MMRYSMMRNSERFLVIVVLPILVAMVVVPMLSGRSWASEVGESHEPVVAQGEHVVEGHGVAAGEQGAEGHGVAEEPWWKFTGWEVVFAVLASVFFLFLTRWLPVILEDKSGGSSL